MLAATLLPPPGCRPGILIAGFQCKAYNVSAVLELTRHQVSNCAEESAPLQVARTSRLKILGYGTVKIFPEYGSLTLLPEG